MNKRWILARYISNQVLLPTLAITIIALLLFTSTRFVRLLEGANGTELFSSLLYILVLNIPNYLVEVLPLGLFLGVLLGIGQMYAENEMSAILSSGVPFKLIRNTLLMIGFTGAIALWILTLFIAPSLSKIALDYQREISNRNPFELVQTGTFNKLNSKGDVLYIEESSNESELMTEIFIAQPNRDTFIWGNSAELLTINEQSYFSINQGALINNGLNEQTAQFTFFKSYSFALDRPEQQHYRLQSTTMTNKELLDSKRRWELTEFINRISFPPIMITMAMLGLSFAKTNPRSGRFKMFLPAILCYSFYTLMLSASIRPVYRGNASFWQAYWWVHLLFLILAIALHYSSYSQFKKSNGPTKSRKI